MNNSNQLCRCGCGRETNTDPNGQPRHYLRGHNRKGCGKGWIEQGRRFISIDGKKKALARHLVEQREGRTLDRDEIAHHIDHNCLNDDPTNLTILARGEHTRLHHSGSSHRRWTTEEKQRAFALSKAGMAIQEIALALKRPYSGTRWQLAKLRNGILAMI
jgi:hypothetical protein